MVLVDKIKDQINKGMVFGDISLSESLVQYFWQSAEKNGIYPQTYQTSVFLDQTDVIHSQQVKIKLPFSEAHYPPIYLETGNEPVVSTFLSQQNLKSKNINESNQTTIIKQLHETFNIICQAPAIASEIVTLVRAITILETPDEEIDVSYSHPGIPFSIFVSIGKTNDDIRYIRTAESIVHEAMHLKLSLLELHVPLVKENNPIIFFSPWKLEMRPIQGILHGLFVFRMLWDFYKSLSTLYTKTAVYQFILYRLEDITKEINEVASVTSSDGFTEEGKRLVSALLKGNFAQIIDSSCGIR